MLTPQNIQNGIFARHSHVPGCCTSLAGGSYNEREAYLYFSRASLEYLAVAGQSPNVIHLHEWQAAGATSNNQFSRVLSLLVLPLGWMCNCALCSPRTCGSNACDSNAAQLH